MLIGFTVLAFIAAIVLAVLAFKAPNNHLEIFALGGLIIVSIALGVLSDRVYQKNNVPSAMDVFRGDANIYIIDGDTIVLFNSEIHTN